MVKKELVVVIGRIELVGRVIIVHCVERVGCHGKGKDGGLPVGVPNAKSW